MLNKIIHFSIHNKLIIGLLTIFLIAYGAYQSTQLPIDAVPDITDNQVQVITIAPSFGATDIERLVTFPIEQANSNIAGIKEIRSFSRFGLSLVTIVFDDKTDVYWARQQVAERLQQVQSEIPKGIGTPELGPISTGLGEIYQYVVKPKKGYENKYDATELRTIQDWIVRRQLLGVQGVAEVSSFGGKLKQFEIAVNPNKLQSYGITIHDIFDAVEKNNQNTGGSYIEKGATVLFIRSEGLIGSIEDIENISISAKSGTPLFLRDVAQVKIGYATRYGAMCYNDQGEVSGAVVMMLKGANSSEVIKNVKERVAQIQKTLPEGVVIEPFLDRTKMVNNAISTVSTNLLEGALIVIFVLVLFLGNFRAGILVASVIPLAMLFAIILMNAFGVSGNLMSLGALDFGLIVDGAVIIVEAVMHQLSHSNKFPSLSRLSPKEMDGEVEYSASKMMNSAVFGQVIILIVYLPIFTLEGIEGKMFKPMAQTVAFALLGAFLLSLTYIPMMSALFLSKKTKPEPNISDRIMNKIVIFYQKMLEKVMNFPKTVLFSTCILFATAIITLSQLGGEFIPALEEGDFAVETRVLAGSNLNVSVDAATKAAKILKDNFPEVEKVVSKIGSGEVPTDPMPIEAQDLMIILKDKSKWTSAKNFDELAEKMGKALEDVPGVTFGFQYPVQMRFNELMTGAKQDVVCKIFGENLDTLALYSEKMGKIIHDIEGAEGLFIETVTGVPEVLITYHRAAIAQYNLNIADINKVINTAFAGQSTGLLFEGEKRFELVVKLENEQRKSLEDVQNLLIPTPNGTQISLSQVANVVIQEGPNQIQREDAKRRIVVGFNVKNVDIQTVVENLQAKVEKELKFPAGYFVTYGGAFENLKAANQRLMIAVPVSLILIFILLFFAFNSIRQSLLIYSAIPLSAIGGIFFLALREMPFSISAGIGFIALFGVAVLNGIVLIAEFNRLRAEGIDDLQQVVLQGTSVRLRPVLMTAFVASLGFLPMALSNGSGAEVQRPLATVVIGGLLIATFLTLFVLPILYLIFEKKNLKTATQSSILVVFLFCGNAFLAKAQTPISLETAIEMAIKNNLSVKNERLKAEYQQLLVKTAKNIPAAQFSNEFGQFNSAYFDHKIGANQSFALPTVYKKQKQWLTEEAKMAALNVAAEEKLLKRSVSETFNHLHFLAEKERLLLQQDTIISTFLKKTELRLAKGESNILEKTNAETAHFNLILALQQVAEEKKILQLQLQLLLHSETNIDIEKGVLKVVKAFSDSVNWEKQPSLAILQQQKKVNQAEIEVEKTKFLPMFSLGYSNMTIRGTGANDIFYNGVTRFHSAQVLVEIPLFRESQKAKIEAATMKFQIIDNELLREKNALENKYQTAFLTYQNQRKIVEFYEQKILPNGKIIERTADKQFQNGEINYLEWAMLMQQNFEAQHHYLEAIHAMNEATIFLNNEKGFNHQF